MEGRIFGWAPTYYELPEDIKFNGRVCKSGLAIPIWDESDGTRPQAKCVNIYGALTDQAEYNFTKNPETAPKCLAKNIANYCYYYTSTYKTEYFQTRCYCSGDGSVGYCPLPTPTFMANYTMNELDVLSNMANCHTKDRDNMMAHYDCGIGAGSVLETISNYKTRYMHWPYFVGEEAYECSKSVFS